ncbi:DNA-binding protein [Suicoccus acidiformans]|uniref:DNA-binding protein n=1 Tax=Suicoccus acidiformans TaxID=2036206 RepID=A0A347WNJ9_9LACT|nr:NYN domain-containing protein [Suicoccus acidiformans]AXY26656.1 DNA-binding protein [Suicoccus acidiformans]
MKRQDILFVDGYNMIGAWPQLSNLKDQDEIAAARDLLLFELSNYRKYRDISVFVVFDAQFVPGISNTYEEYEVQVVFTQEGETADTYIEREVAKFINPLNRVVVATSDAAEQWLIFQRGALRQSADELLMEINYAKVQIQSDVKQHYNQALRRRSPWKLEQLEMLDQLRFDMENSEDQTKK